MPESAKVYGNVRVVELSIKEKQTGVILVPIEYNEGIPESITEDTDPLGLTQWASKVDASKW